MYHTNRLIKAYERVGCQLRANKVGVGVIGIIECDFLEPMHNKQSFVKSDEYRKKPDQKWALCEECLKWRKIPDGIDDSELPDKWFCWMNPDNQFRSCDVEEEPEDYDDETSGYTKTFKQQEKEDKKKKEKKTQQSPSTPKTSKSVPEDAESSLRTSSTILQAAVSLPVTNVLPVISGVCSLSTSQYALRKRAAPSPLTTPKRTREDLLPSTSGTSAERGTCSPADPADVEDSDDQTDDIFSTLEAHSIPKPVDDVSNDEQEINYIEYNTWNWAPEYEELQHQMQQQADNTRSPARSNSCSAQTQTENPAGSAETDFQAKRSLIKLRQNVARLLVPHMPYLELDQVNYECNVIDVLLEQHLSSLDSNRCFSSLKMKTVFTNK
ncbi:hypothetical protein OJAV_G00203850 [Oryzias javanicus]|uniref:CW-type domain-containing protein n=1 Tax=Oryzias javanicus TaxID=123683 RepID=A0A437C5D2_ORYJA|nr:hypothetical protein OJAV_G00203850 [Oryzias javanicus]